MAILYLFIGLAASFALIDQPWYFWIIYVSQLVSNLLFSPINFGLKNILGGAIVTTLTLFLAVLNTIEYAFMYKIASVVLMLPYLMWLIFCKFLRVVYLCP